MPHIEFASYFFRFIPPMGGRRVCTKMIQRPVESNKQPAQIWTQSNFFFGSPLWGPRDSKPSPSGGQKTSAFQSPIRRGRFRGACLPAPDGILGRQVRPTPPFTPPCPTQFLPTTAHLTLRHAVLHSPAPPSPAQHTLHLPVQASPKPPAPQDRSRPSAPYPALPRPFPAQRPPSGRPRPAQPTPAQPSPAQSSPLLPRIDRNSTVNSSNLKS